MKKLLVTITATLVCVAAFGQAKMSFCNNGNHLIYFSSDTTRLLPADANTIADGYPIAGSGAYIGTDPTTGLPGTIASLQGSPTFVAALYDGTSSNSLSLQTVTSIDTWGNEGMVVPVDMTFAHYPSGVAVYFPIRFFGNVPAVLH
jgi:hypothetical protein